MPTPTRTGKPAITNPAPPGTQPDPGPTHAETFRRDLHPGLRSDYFPANPPFNDSDWFRKDDDARWQFGVPPKGNANFAWVQHFIHHLAPQGMAGFVLANGSMSSNQSGDCPLGPHSKTRPTNSHSLGRQRDSRRALDQRQRRNDSQFELGANQQRASNYANS